MGSTHRWDGRLYRAFESSGMPDLFPPSEEHGVNYYSDHNGTRYNPVFAPRREYEPSDQVTIVELTEISARVSMLQDEYERLQNVKGVVAEVVRGHAGTGRLHIDLPFGSVKHIADHVEHIYCDPKSGIMYVHPSQVSRVREIAASLKTAK